MVSLINLPAYQAPNALNFSGINNAIDSTRQNALMQRQMGMQEQQLGMQKERFGMEKQQFEQEQKTAAMRRFAIQTAEIDKIADPVQRKSAWDQHLATHPDTKSIPLNYWDPVNGPKMVLQEAEGFLGRGEKAKLGLIEAQTQKALREAANGGETPANIREWQAFQRMSPEQQQQYLTMKRAEKYLDTGTGFVRPNPVAPGGPPVASIPKDIAGKAAQQAQGTEQGKAIVDLPKVKQAASTTLKYVDEVLRDRNLDNVTGWQARLPTLRSASVDTEERIAQLGGRAFLSAFESLKGGGQITEIEGQKATQALARLTNLKQSDAGFKTALKDFRGEVMDLVRIAEQRARGAGPYVPPPGTPTDAVQRENTDRLPPSPPGWSIKRID